MGAWQVVSATLGPSTHDADDLDRVVEVTVINDSGRRLVLEVSRSYLTFAQELSQQHPAALDDLELPAAAILSVREI